MIMFDISNHKNSDLLRYLGNAENCSPAFVADPYLRLGTHPDLVERLWDQLTVNLPVNCRWAVGKRPVLMRRDSGVVFGIAIGTAFYALRLPELDRSKLEDAKGRLVERWADKHDIQGKDRQHYYATQLEACPVGPDWISGLWLDEEIEMCQHAYDWAA